MIPFSPTVAAHIHFLLDSLTDSNFDSVLRELSQFVEYGSEGSILLLQAFVDQVNYREGDSELKSDLFSRIIRYLMNQPNFSTVFCEAFGNMVIDDCFLRDLSNTLRLSALEKISIGLSLSDSENLDLRIQGQNFCIAQIEELCENPAAIDSHELVQNIIMFLSQSQGFSKYVDSFTKMLSLVGMKGRNPGILSPMLADGASDNKPLRQLDLFYESCDNDFDTLLAEIEKELSMADVMKELGYGCTVDESHCKEMLSLFSPLNEVTVSRIVSTIARTHSCLEDSQNIYSTFCSAFGAGSITDSSSLSSWNTSVLVDSIKQLAPEINWLSVMENLDHEGFYFPDEHAFSLFMSIYKSACQEPFPLHVICGSVWNNAEGQLSFLRYAVSALPEIFTFAHSSRKLSVICSQHGYNLPSVDANEAWLCLDLIEVLCQLAERGHANTIRGMLESPLKQYPDVLLIGLAYVNTNFNLLQREVSSSVFPIMLGNSAGNNSLLILWNINPSLVLNEFINAHLADPDNMTNVLDVCQELKILSSVLDMTPFSFSIKLAAFASKKELVNLEKWLTEYITIYRDVFYEECLKFWREISGDVVNGCSSQLQHSTVAGNVYAESSSTLLKVLQASEQPFSRQLVEEMKRLQITSGSSDSIPSEGSSDDVEHDANKYFHQMFSGQLSVDAMVQMLARFKDSHVKREKSIFECIIAYIFEEYRFYPKYPERQLKIAAVLFGSVIKHKLVGHLTLGMALRYVLDALRKSVDSKMFLFGAKALEQFMDRLVEWPQYCNHILQISHLRSTQSELVTFIERALARVSSGQPEPSGANNAPMDQHQGSTSQENVEASEASWQLLSNVQAGQPVSSPVSSTHQLQLKHQALLDERQKTSVASNSYVKPFLSSSAQSPSGSINIETLNNSQKATSSQSLPVVPPQTGTSLPASVPASSGFARSSRGLPSSGMLRQSSYSTGFGAALNIETLVVAAEKRDTPIDAPASEIQDKIFFMINNISTANLDTKGKEFTDILNEQYYPWFAQYMVMKRASIEPNFHDLYLKFLDKVNSRVLNAEIVKATYENCKVLLRSELIKSSSEERSLLKNLGSWLGKFTIGRNQALRAREIDPKLLIIEAYERGLMIAVIPFTSKILEPCQSSLAYQPPNPWTMGILGLLAEIYALPNLKMNLKFDIEVLFKNLGVDMKDVKPTSLLRDRRRETEGNPDFSTKDMGAPQPQVVNDVNAVKISALNQVELQPEISNSALPSGHVSALNQFNSASLHLPSSSLGDDEKIATLNLSERLPSGQGLSTMTPSQSSYPTGQLPTAIPNIGAQIIVNSKLSALGLNMQFQRVLPLAMERAIREIINPVVHRSVTIAMLTTKELVLKDYSMESDEGRIFNAAHLMVASLAGSLAHVTCKEPLRTALTNHLKNMLTAIVANAELLEQAVQLMTNDNLDLGCAIIEQSATERAIQTIDGEIAPQLAQRRKLREEVGSQYYDATTYAQGPFARVPEALRPKPGRLSPSQQRVYEDFVRTWQNQSSQSSSAVPSGVAGTSAGPVNPGLSRVYSSSGQPISSIYPAAQMAQGFGAVAQQIDFIPEEIDPGSSQILSNPSTHVGATDGLQHGIDVNATVSPFTSTTATIELDVSSAVNELGALMLSSSTPTERLGGSVSEPLLTTGDAVDKYQIVAQKLDTLIAKDAADADVQGVIAEFPEILLRCVSKDEAALAVAQRVFKRLYDNASNSLHVSSHLSVLVAIRDVCKLVVKELTRWVIYSDEERKFNEDITIGLIRSELLNLAEYNVHLAKLIDGGRNRAATDFSISLAKALVLQEPTVSVSELYNLIDALTKLAMRPGSPESLQQLVEIAKNTSANAGSLPGFAIGKDDKARQSKDKKVPLGRSVTNQDEFGMTEPTAGDPAGFRDQAAVLFNDWCQICESPAATDAARSHFMSQLQHTGFLKGDDVTDRFFCIITELTVAHCLCTADAVNSNLLSLHASQQVQLSFIAIDMYAKLIMFVLKFSSMEHTSTKTILLPRILSVTVRVIQRDADEKKSSFNPRPYFRLFVNLLIDLGSPDAIFDASSFQILTAFANAFHALQPLKVPFFSFVWLELISHRSFMPKLLMSPSQKGWPFVQRLLVDLFKFMEPYLRSAELGDSVQYLYRGTLRVLLVLLHDFPEFLCDYHFSFCDVIPSSCIQMRNVILSAFPRNMRLPDPSTPNLKIDLLAEISQSPHILSEVDTALKAKQLKADIDEYLKTRQQGASPLTELKQKLLLPQNEAALAGTRYNIPLINSLVLYVGMQAIQQLQNKSPPPSPTQMSHTPPMDIFFASTAMEIYKSLIRDLDTEGRYYFLNAIANQLRYPNNHTHYFSFVLLYLFAEANQEIIQEQITRVLLERLIVNRPHPWGLLITFIELIKNPRYDFWSRGFTRCAPEIEKLFESVSRSCGGPKAVDDAMVSGGI